jgi:hypothetical protein
MNQLYKVHFSKSNKKEGIKSYNWFQIVCTIKHAPFHENICSLDELDEKLNHSKVSKSWNFKQKAYKAKDSF